MKIAVDGQPAIEIDCAGSRPRATLIDEVIEAINSHVKDLASVESKGIKLTAPTPGVGGSILLEDVENSASVQLFGEQLIVTVGIDAAPATIFKDLAAQTAEPICDRARFVSRQKIPLATDTETNRVIHHLQRGRGTGLSEHQR